MCSRTWPFQNSRYLLPSYQECLLVSELGLGGDFGQIKLLCGLLLLFSVAIMTQKTIFKNIFYHLDVFIPVYLTCDASLVLKYTHTLSNFRQPPCLSFRGDPRHIPPSIPGQSFCPITTFQRFSTLAANQDSTGSVISRNSTEKNKTHPHQRMVTKYDLFI